MHKAHLFGVLVGSLVLGACAPTPTGTTSSPSTTTTSSTTTTTVPAEIEITSSFPESPSTSTTPRLIGFAPAAASTVRVFATADCTGPAVAGGTPADFASTGFGVSVGLASSTSFTALATGPGLVTACSSPFVYVNTLTAPTGNEVEPNNGVDQANALTADVGSSADIAGHLDGFGVSDLFTFHVAAGRSIRVETFDWTGLTCVMTDTHIYLSPLDAGLGGNDDDGGVDQCSLLGPGVAPYGPNMVDVAGGDYLLNVQGSPLGGAYRVRVEVLP
jgi:hypothetical protein